MSIARSEGGDALSLDQLPAEDTASAESPSALGTRLQKLRALWSGYVTENKRGWDDIVEEQAKDPTLG